MCCAEPQDHLERDVAVEAPIEPEDEFIEVAIDVLRA